MIKAVCFDLDGTLLPLDVDEFCKHYFGMLARHMAPFGYDPKALIGGIMAGTKAMHKNDGTRTNEQAFWDEFCKIFGEDARNDERKFAAFYETEFDKARAACGFDPASAPAVRACKELHDLILHFVRILELVHENIAETPRKVLPHFLMSTQEVARLVQKVVKIERIVLLQMLLIARVHLDDFVDLPFSRFLFRIAFRIKPQHLRIGNMPFDIFK